MRVALAALLLALALAGCDRVTAPVARYDPGVAGSVDQALCRLGFTGVPMRALVTGHHLVEGRLNGRRATFLVDTGANKTVVTSDRVSVFGLRATPVAIGGATGLGGSIRAGLAPIERLELGGVAIRQRQVMTADLSGIVGVMGRLAGREIDGIVGQDALAEHRAVIDVARPILYLIAADRDPEPVAGKTCAKT